jgi:hypothetical protein
VLRGGTDGTADTCAFTFAFLNLLAACGIGAAVGFLVSFIFRQPWGLRALGIDVALAAAGFVLGAFLLSGIATSSGKLQTGVQWLFLISSCAAAVRHVVVALRKPRGGRGIAE